MTDIRDKDLHGIARPLHGFVSHQLNRFYIDAGQANWLSSIADDIEAKHEQVLSEAMENVRVRAYDSGFDNGVKACLQQLEGLIARGDTIEEIRGWADRQWEEEVI